MWECKVRNDGGGEWGGPDFMTVEGPGFSLSGPAYDINVTPYPLVNLMRVPDGDVVGRWRRRFRGVLPTVVLSTSIATASLQRPTTGNAGGRLRRRRERQSGVVRR